MAEDSYNISRTIAEYLVDTYATMNQVEGPAKIEFTYDTYTYGMSVEIIGNIKTIIFYTKYKSNVGVYRDYTVFYIPDITGVVYENDVLTVHADKMSVAFEVAPESK